MNVSCEAKIGGGEAFLDVGGDTDELTLDMGGEDGLVLGGGAGVGEGRELSPREPVSGAESVSEAGAKAEN